jgi:ATP-dependent Clp protease ATP-binding subunit ClpC
MVVLAYLLAMLAGAVLMYLWLDASKTGTPAPDTDAETPALPPDPAIASDSPPAPSTLPDRILGLTAKLDEELRMAATPADFATKPGFTEVRALLADPATPLKSVLDQVASGNALYSCPALAALAERPDRDTATSAILADTEMLGGWPLHFTLKYLERLDTRRPAGTILVAVRDWWRDDTFHLNCIRQHFDELERLGDTPCIGDDLTGRPQEQLAAVTDFLRRLRHPFANALLEDLARTKAKSIDREFLQTLGRFWSDTEIAGLVEPYGWTDAMEAVMAKRSANGTPRSLLVNGETRVGKTCLLKLLAKRLEPDGWIVFEAGSADLMAGQQYFGQLEARIQRCLEELTATKKIIWVVPDLMQLANSGTHQGQSSSILDQILPAVSAGRIVVWTEASSAAATKLLRLRPSLKSTFEVLRLDPMEPEDALELAHEFAADLQLKTGVTFAPGTIDTAAAAARQYLGASNLPGSVIDLLRMSVVAVAKDPKAVIADRDIVATIAQLTGLPGSIIDGNERVDLSAVRDYFSSRVMGQDEAVEAIVSRIAMLKAGLTDPGKPIGVFLFAGPTGTGKTELAKTLAEFLFGTPERMIRLDMSEFQTPESTVKILGSADTAGSDSLISLIRKQPFSVILLDEFEKAHPNVWDLFLQVFDDGRLTDQMGQVADFRYAIIILTSNLGATVHRGSRLGFAPGESAYTPDQVMQTIGQTFRPEFQNRLDKIIVFRPLSRDLMRGILKKELARVLERRGFKDREWAVEWEASAMEFLLEKGFTPEMGARPLKRAIDQYLIAPLAAAIVEKRFPEGDQFVFVRSDGRAIQAEFVDPDADDETHDALTIEHANGEVPSLPAMILAAEGSDIEIAELEAQTEDLNERLTSSAWEDLRLELAERMAAPGFWSHPSRFETLARIALMDRVRAANETVDALKTRLEKGAARSGRSSRELISRLALQVYLVGEGIRDAHEDAPVELLLAVEPAFDRPGEKQASIEWCRTLLDMYRAWGRNRNMQISETTAEPAAGLPRLFVSGFGAARALENEKGLHVLERDDGEGGSARATARISLVPAPLANVPPHRIRDAMETTLATTERSSTVVRRYRGDPAPLVRDLVSGWRSGRYDTIIAGNFDLIAAR